MLEKVLHRGKSRSSPDLVAKAVATLQRLDEGNATDKQVKPAAVLRRRTCAGLQWHVHCAAPAPAHDIHHRPFCNAHEQHLQVEEVSKSLSFMKATMFAAGESETSKEAAVVTAYEVRQPPFGHAAHAAAAHAPGSPSACFADCKRSALSVTALCVAACTDDAGFIARAGGLDHGGAPTD